MQRILIGIGVVCVLVGLAWPWPAKFGIFRLPGDIVIERENFRFYFPITSMIIFNAVVLLIVWLWRK